MRFDISGVLLTILLLAVAAVVPLRADDAESSSIFKEALKAFNDKDYVDAAELFAKAENKADSVDLKLKAALREVESYRKAGYRGKEFDAIEKVIRRYPGHIDYKKLVDREFALGDAYFHGYADPAFWSLRFIPFLTDKDRMFEIYEAALKHAPFAPAGATARLRLAVRCLKADKNDKALTLLKEIIRIYPDTEAARYAMLELGNAFSEMSLAGDGDGKHFDEAMSIFKEFKEKYPNLSENEWVKHSEAKARNAYAQRLHNIAAFYHREGRDEPAAAYLMEVMSAISMYDVAPVFNETLLERKYTRDSESMAMLELIDDSRVYNLHLVISVGGLSNITMNAYSSNKVPTMSDFDAVKESALTAINNLIDEYEAIPR